VSVICNVTRGESKSGSTLKYPGGIARGPAAESEGRHVTPAKPDRSIVNPHIVQRWRASSAKPFCTFGLRLILQQPIRCVQRRGAAGAVHYIESTEGR